MYLWNIDGQIDFFFLGKLCKRKMGDECGCIGMEGVVVLLREREREIGVFIGKNKVQGQVMCRKSGRREEGIYT